jgi:FAD/FMN-containing dehydrogenase
MQPSTRAASEPARSWEWVEGWGMAVGAHGRVLRPRDVDGIRAAFDMAHREGVSIGLRGTGNSYGDASVNTGGLVLDVSAMNRILAWDPATGVVEVEPGVTVEQLWKRILPDGWWPAVVSGTMFPTLAGAVAMNIHGKNNFAVGPLGDHVLEFDLVTPDGAVHTASRERDSDLFHAAIGGFGMLGCFSRIVLRTKRVYSGELRVRVITTRNLADMIATMEDRRATSDYMVGWIDCFAAGDRSGRGLVHVANYLKPGEDQAPESTLRVSHQELPASILGVFPKNEVWRILRLFNNDPGMRLINALKYWGGRMQSGHAFRQSHAGFAFLLDYVPNWKFAYGREPGARGLIQFQSFLPKETALEAYTEMLARSREARLVPYLGVFKRHRPDPFWMTHAVDGWSFAMDHRVTPENRARLWAHCDTLTGIVLAAGGRFYFAKDLVIGNEDMLRYVPPENLSRFLALKRRLDPATLLQTDLYRRVFRGVGPPVAAPSEPLPC